MSGLGSVAYYGFHALKLHLEWFVVARPFSDASSRQSTSNFVLTWDRFLLLTLEENALHKWSLDSSRNSAGGGIIYTHTPWRSARMKLGVLENADIHH
jgi:hypothetical protein